MNDNNVAVGSVNGVGAAINVRIGFKPRYVSVFNPNDADKLYPLLQWWEGMPAASGSLAKNNVHSYISEKGISQYSGEAGTKELTGTFSVTSGSITLAATSGLFTTELDVNDFVTVNGESHKVIAIANNTSLTVDAPFGATATGKKGYRHGGAEEGFTIGSNSDINVSGEKIFYMAIR